MSDELHGEGSLLGYIHGVPKSQTQMSDYHTHTHTHTQREREGSLSENYWAALTSLMELNDLNLMLQ